MGENSEFVVEHNEVCAFEETSGLAPLVNYNFYMVDKSFLSAFVERWHQETSSFHPPFCEMTITLNDVSLLLHRSITGVFSDSQRLTIERLHHATGGAYWHDMCTGNYYNG